ncbi:hypothetical protein F2Q69_00062419 [Brassica cretica]|uniref:Uncharacterized protein n=1 Tax=Brassica cretica TaxID=69181 RepID=A0A8S9RRQ6_BRACR|nr:hypothetical protein F2Q69_00062419 [Brassica cretica]
MIAWQRIPRSSATAHSSTAPIILFLNDILPLIGLEMMLMRRAREELMMLIHRKKTICFCALSLSLSGVYTIKFLSLTVSETNPLIIYLINVEKLLESERFYNLFQILMNKISGPVLILGSRVLVPEDDFQEVDEEVSALFPYNIEIRPHEDESQLSSWKKDDYEDGSVSRQQEPKSEPKIVVATSINPTLLIASRNVFRRKNASLMFNKGRWSCFRLTLTAKHLFISW